MGRVFGVNSSAVRSVLMPPSTGVEGPWVGWLLLPHMVAAEPALQQRTKNKFRSTLYGVNELPLH